MSGTRIELVVGRERFAALAHGEEDAPPVLCLHGFPDHPPTFSLFAEALAARGYRVVVPWLRGYAPSPLGGRLDLLSLAADGAGLLDAIGDKRGHRYLVGHDWGAAILYTLLATRPGAVKAACAISVPHPIALLTNAASSPAQLLRSRYMATFQRAAADDEVRRDDFRALRELWTTWSPDLILDDAIWRPLRETLAASHPRPLDYYRALIGVELVKMIPSLRRSKIATPTTTLFGDRDGCISATMARGSHRFFAGEYALEVLSGVGHFVHVEAPDQLAARVAARLV